jgi:hypothetical protein
MRLPDDKILKRDVEVAVMDRWKDDELVNEPGRHRNGFWAQVYRLVGSKQVAKCVINYGLSNMDSLSAVLHEVIEHKDTDVHKRLVLSNALPITETQSCIRSSAKWFKYKCKRACRHLEEVDDYSRQHVAWMDSQCALYVDMRNQRKRKFVDLTGQAMHDARLIGVFDSIGPCLQPQ